MSDWLSLHQISARDCLSILDSAPTVTGNRSGPDRLPPEMSADEVWQLCGQAMAEAIPPLAPEIKRVATRALTNFTPDLDRYPRAFTLHDSGNGEPYVSCPWSGRFSDMLAIAHEFGHALQIVASEGQNPAPVTREICAFAGESLLIRHQSRRGAPNGEALWNAFLAETVRLMAKPAGALREALTIPGTPYDYEWNYPLARAALLLIEQDASPDRLASLFRTKITLASLVG